MVKASELAGNSSPFPHVKQQKHTFMYFLFPALIKCGPLEKNPALPFF